MCVAQTRSAELNEADTQYNTNSLKLKDWICSFIELMPWNKNAWEGLLLILPSESTPTPPPALCDSGKESRLPEGHSSMPWPPVCPLSRLLYLPFPSSWLNLPTCPHSSTCHPWMAFSVWQLDSTHSQTCTNDEYSPHFLGAQTQSESSVCVQRPLPSSPARTHCPASTRCAPPARVAPAGARPHFQLLSATWSRLNAAVSIKVCPLHSCCF